MQGTRFSEDVSVTFLVSYQISVVRRSPPDPQVDLAILSQSHHFIGNCISSFTAIVKRDRDINNKASSFWNYK